MCFSISIQIRSQSIDSILQAHADIGSLKAELEKCRIQLSEKNKKIEVLKQKMKVSSQLVTELFWKESSDECEETAPTHEMENSIGLHDNKIENNDESVLTSIKIQQDENDNEINDANTEQTSENSSIFIDQEQKIVTRNVSLLTPLRSKANESNSQDFSSQGDSTPRAKKFISQSRLSHHRKIQKSRYACKICEIIFKKRSSFLQHREKHNKTNVSCNICHKTYTLIGNLKRHQRVSH